MKILQIDSSLKTNGSYSKQLSDALIEKLKEKEPSATVVLRSLKESNLSHFTEEHLTAFTNNNQTISEDESRAVRLSEELIEELQSADTIVIGVPMYNLTIPSILKSWIDFILRAGKTFRYTAEGPEGLVKNKKIYLAISTGGVFSEGHHKKLDHTESYLRAVLGFIGMTDVEVFRVEGSAIPELKEDALPKAYKRISEHSFI